MHPSPADGQCLQTPTAITLKLWMFIILKLPLPLDFSQMTRLQITDLTLPVPIGMSGHGIILDV